MIQWAASSRMGRENRGASKVSEEFMGQAMPEGLKSSSIKNSLADSYISIFLFVAFSCLPFTPHSLEPHSFSPPPTTCLHLHLSRSTRPSLPAYTAPFVGGLVAAPPHTAMEDQEQLTEVVGTSRIKFCGNPAVIREEVKQLFLLAGPLVLTQVMTYSLNFISSAFGGHLGKYELGAISLATSVISVTGVAVGTGLSMACDTLISQMYGSKQLKQIGVVLQRAILILMVFCCPCWALFINTEKILLAARQDPEVARLCQLYVTIFIPALPAVFLYQIQVRYLQNQGIIMPQVFTGIVANVLSVVMNYSFLIVLKLGVVGSACANLISQYCQTIVLLVYIRWRRLYVHTWGGWTRDCLQDWGSFLQLAIPSMVMFCIEFWAYEIGSFLAGLIDQVQLGAQVVIFQFLTILFMIHVGIGMAAGIRVGMALGAGRPQQAKTSAMTALVCTGCVALVLMTSLLLLKDVIAKIFTSNRQIIELVSSTIPIIAPFHLCDAIGSGAASGIVRGIGMQKVGAIANLVAFYIVGIPVGIALMFAAKIGILGLWAGLAISTFLLSAFFLTLIFRMDWGAAAQEASAGFLHFDRP
ncbi:multidrug and toxin extrusion protein 2-like [Amblyraja radiata]|uniref:multidrug and toxin extrusion protein 2-like n=1 Tax=Amblyraja radiata TaxID=386614 RepID=UPI00140294C7|nr:multidrug and toxin extrusion protein 2-like [Amblyraja radiata]